MAENTNRELLELAAKAAGMKFDWRGLYGILPAIFSDDDEPTKWNPLDDDGDALRLAVKLRMEVYIYEDNTQAIDENLFCASAYQIHDEFSTTRRAIVLCAAQVGRAMP